MEYITTSVIPLPLLYPQNPRERMCLVFISLLVVTITSYISWVLTLDYFTTKFKLHACMHHVVVIVIIVVLALCYFIMSHVTLVFYYIRPC